MEQELSDKSNKTLKHQDMNERHGQNGPDNVTLCKTEPASLEPQGLINIIKLEEEIKHLQEKCSNIEDLNRELTGKIEIITKQKELAVKEKEAMVIRYAVSERGVLEQKQLREQFEKKYKDAVKENDILQHKVQTMNSEKARICQMLDDKCYECKTAQYDLERLKSDLNALENKLKWSQNSLKTEIGLHKESQSKVENLSSKLQEATDQVEQAKRKSEESIKAFHSSEENRAHVLDQQIKEVQAKMIFLKHDRDDKDQQVNTLTLQLDKLQTKQKCVLQENNDLSVKVQQLERDRLDNEQKLNELRACADQQRQDSADIQAKSVQLDQLKLQLKNEQDQLKGCKEHIDLLKQRNTELEADMVACLDREAELLLFTQQLTDKNVRLQSEFIALETKVQQLSCEQTVLKRSIKEQETRSGILTAQLAEERVKHVEEKESLTTNLTKISTLCEKYKQEAADQKGENSVVQRKFQNSLREVNKELQQCRRRLEQYENVNSASSSSSNSSISVGDRSNSSPAVDQIKKPDADIDRQTLIEHIVKLQRISARKSEKLDFLEEHVNTLVGELQKKSRLLQSYILRDQAGTLTSNTTDRNKANLMKLNGLATSVYTSHITDNNPSLELSPEINRKLQAVLEDVLLKNITLKENVDTLGQEIDKLNNQLKSQVHP